MVGVPEEREGNNGSEEWRGGGGKKTLLGPQVQTDRVLASKKGAPNRQND